MTENSPDNFTVVELEQGTDEWHLWRSEGIGASDAPVIMGENPWKSVHTLRYERQRRAYLPNRNEMSLAMSRGIELEPLAREAYCQLKGVTVIPMCLESAQYPWMRCSLDGLSLGASIAVEIKCGNSVYNHAYRKRRIPSYYYGQLQHILAVTGYNEIDFFCYLPGKRPLVLDCPRNDEYIDRLIKREKAFYSSIQQ